MSFLMADGVTPTVLPMAVSVIIRSLLLLELLSIQILLHNTPTLIFVVLIFMGFPGLTVCKWHSKDYDHTHSCHVSFGFAPTDGMVTFKVVLKSFCNLIDMVVWIILENNIMSACLSVFMEPMLFWMRLMQDMFLAYTWAVSQEVVMWQEDACRVGCAFGVCWSCQWGTHLCIFSGCDASLQIKSSYFLVSIVDNDYINGDLFSVFAGLWGGKWASQMHSA